MSDLQEKDYRQRKEKNPLLLRETNEEDIGGYLPSTRPCGTCSTDGGRRAL
jgi:hypothetical protein